jgi:cation diffusion facilitator CzcD-associated flavoprotein CzcO
LFSSQPEIQDYIRGVARRAGLLDRTVFGCELKRAAWQEQHSRWEESTSHGTLTADVLIGAFGALAEPSLLDIPGIDTFEGEVFHSAQWNHSAELTGKRLAVIGTGASAIQIVPAIADAVGHGLETGADLADDRGEQGRCLRRSPSCAEPMRS